MESENLQPLLTPLSISNYYLAKQSFGKGVAKTRKTLTIIHTKNLLLLLVWQVYGSVSLGCKRTRKIRQI